MTAIQEDEIFGEPEPVMSAAERREMEIQIGRASCRERV